MPLGRACRVVNRDAEDDRVAFVERAVQQISTSGMVIAYSEYVSLCRRRHCGRRRRLPFPILRAFLQRAQAPMQWWVFFGLREAKTDGLPQI